MNLKLSCTDIDTPITCYLETNYCIKIRFPLIDLSMMVILSNCVTLGMYQPCVDELCDNNRCKHLQLFDHLIFAFFTLEMMIKVLAMGFIGKGAYLAETWNRLDGFIVVAGALEYCLDIGNMNLTAIRTIRVLRPIRAINRIPSMRILVMLLLDTLPMLGNVLLLCFFVFFIFGIVGVQLWAGLLRQRCYLDLPENVRFPGNLPAYYRNDDPGQDYICSLEKDNGIHKCRDLPHFSYRGITCNSTALPRSDNSPTNDSCVNWNQYYRNCRAGEKNPFQGAISFDNIGLAWVAIFLVISLEGWTDVMYYVQDAHSFWDWIYYVLLIVIGSFFMINLCLVVIATQFSETKKREMERMRQERARYHSNSTLTSVSEPLGCYTEMIRYLAHLGRRARRRFVYWYRRMRRKRRREEFLRSMCSLTQQYTGEHVSNKRTSELMLDSRHHVPKTCSNSSSFTPSTTPPTSPRPPSLLKIPSISSLSYSSDKTKVEAALAQKETPSSPKVSVLLTNVPSSVSRDRQLTCAELLALTSVKGALQAAGFVGSFSMHCLYSSVQKGIKHHPDPVMLHFSEDQESSPNDGDWSDLESDGNGKLPNEQRRSWLWWMPHQAKLTSVVNHRYFQRGIFTAILFNTVSMGIEYHDQPEELTHAVELSNLVFTCIFGVEMVLKIMAEGLFGYISNGFNMFDGTIVVISVVELSHSNGSGLSVLRTFRLLRIVKLVRFLPAMRRQLVVMLRTMDNVAVFFSLLVLFIFIFSCLGMHLFGGKFCERADGRGPCTCVELQNTSVSCVCDRKNFNSFLWATVTVFEILTQEDWNLVLFNGMEKTSHWAALYFVALMTFGNYVLFNLLVAILVEGFSAEGDKKQSSDRTVRGSQDFTTSRKHHRKESQDKKTKPEIGNCQEQDKMKAVNYPLHSSVYTKFSPPVIIHTASTPQGSPSPSVEPSIRDYNNRFYSMSNSNSSYIPVEQPLKLKNALVTPANHLANVYIDVPLTQKEMNPRDLNTTSHSPVNRVSKSEGDCSHMAPEVTSDYDQSSNVFFCTQSSLSLNNKTTQCIELREVVKNEYLGGSSVSPYTLTSNISFLSINPQHHFWFSSEFFQLDSNIPQTSARADDILVGNLKQESGLSDESLEQESGLLAESLKQESGLLTESFEQESGLSADSLNQISRLSAESLKQESVLFAESLKEKSGLSAESIKQEGSLSSEHSIRKEVFFLHQHRNQTSIEKSHSISLTYSDDQYTQLEVWPEEKTVSSWKAKQPYLDLTQETDIGSDWNHSVMEQLPEVNATCYFGEDGFEASGFSWNRSLFQIQSETINDARQCNGRPPTLRVKPNDLQPVKTLNLQNSIKCISSSSQTFREATPFTIHSPCSHQTSRTSSIFSSTNAFNGQNYIPTVRRFSVVEVSEPKEMNVSESPESEGNIEDEVYFNGKLCWLVEPEGWIKERQHLSLFVFSKSNRFRMVCSRLADDKRFDYSVLFFIALNCITLAMERPNIPPDSTERTILTAANYVFTAVFALEMFIKVVAKGLWYGKYAYLKNGWNIMDGSLVLVSMVDFMLSFIAFGSPRIFAILRVFRLLRSLRPLRVINRAPGLKLVVQTLLSSLRPIGNIVLICCTFFIIFGILGVQLFKGKLFYCDGPDVKSVKNKTDCLADPRNQWINRKYNFDNLGQALMSLFVLASKDGWVEIMYTGLDAVDVDQQPVQNYSEWRLLYFISFLLLVAFFVLNMFVGVVVENFHRCREEQEKEEKARRIAKRAHKLEKKRKKMREPPYYINYSKPRLFNHNIVTSKYFDLAIAAVIGLNVVTMAMEFYMMPLELVYALKIFNYFFTAVFIVEAFMKILAVGGKRYLKDRWNQLDVAIVVLSIAGIIFEEMESEVIPINPTIIRVMRVLRIARVLKLLKMATGIRSLLDTVMQALPQVGNLGLLFFLLFFIFAALGVELFGRLECNKDFPCQGLGEHAHFRNFGMAFLTLFRVATGDNWNGIMKDTLRENCDHSSDCVTNCCVSPVIAPIYFVIFVLMAQFVLVNVVVAVLMKHLEDSHTQDEEDLDIEQQIEQELAAEVGVSQQESGTTEVREAKRSGTKELKPRPLVKMTSLPANFTFTFQCSIGEGNRNVPEIRVISPTDDQAQDVMRVSDICDSNTHTTVSVSIPESSTMKAELVFDHLEDSL
ncbi:voltage-dependent T-type calcium channel subunit alpha-1G-like isoform X2 [Tachypleus tridentatus]|uniref:voltage-dependent T-type calcium channel subunit alpha-1G-like isoform X2 n=1 Tax=Tachypleus tridentatus TaxID=6853 RepID=UPI003FD26E39